MTKPPLTYRDAGVDIEKADRLVQRIKALAGSTLRSGPLAGIGGFASLFGLKEAFSEIGNMDDPVLVSGTDGVGTKLKLAFATGQHDTVGIDLVAMCINDVLTTGATPLFFLDYFATGRLDVSVGEAVISGVAEGCRRAEASLVGGETAELPGLYADGEYDLAGFAVGIVERKDIIDGRSVQEGDVVIGVASSGIHSNGLSLAQKALFDNGGLSIDATLEGLQWSLGRELLRPTAIYTPLIKALRAAAPIQALAHITGGGLPENLPRVLPEGCGVAITRAALPVHRIFEHIAAIGNVEDEEMLRTFNMGVGLAVVVRETDSEAVVAAIKSAAHAAQKIGVITSGGARFEVV